MAEALGAVGSVVVGGVAVFATVALWLWLFPALRRVDRPDECRCADRPMRASRPGERRAEDETRLSVNKDSDLSGIAAEADRAGDARPHAAIADTAPRRAADRQSTPLFHVRSAAYLFISRLSSNGANQMMAVAAGWQVYELTGSALHLGLIGLVQFAPPLLLMLATGQVADRYNRRLILRLCYVLEFCASAGLVLVSALPQTRTLRRSMSCCCSTPRRGPSSNPPWARCCRSWCRGRCSAARSPPTFPPASCRACSGPRSAACSMSSVRAWSTAPAACWCWPLRWRASCCPIRP